MSYCVDFKLTVSFQNTIFNTMVLHHGQAGQRSKSQNISPD